MAGTLAPLALVLSPATDTGVLLDGLTRRNTVDVGLVGLNPLGGPITIFDDRDGNGIPGSGEILATVPNTLVGNVRVNLSEGTHSLRATQTTALVGTTTSLPLTVRVDNTAPTIVSVNQLDVLDPLGLLDLAGVLRYEVTFSEPVLGLTANLFQATGTLPGLHLVTLLPSLAKPNTYIVSIGLGLDGVSLDQRAGTLGLALNPSNLAGVTDLAGNGLRGNDFVQLAPVNIGPARETATADFNADGFGDAAFLVNDTVVVTRGTGTGSLGVTQTVAVAANQATIATGDVTGDGLVDIVTAGAGRVEILRQTAGGGFTLVDRPTTGADGAVVAEVTGDGRADIVVKSLQGNSATVLANAGNGTFTTGQTVALGVRPDAFAAGDFNGDGRIDLAALADGGTALSILTQGTTGAFVRATLTVGASAGGIATGDLNGDGRAEIVTSGTGGTLDIRGFTAAGAVTQATLDAETTATEIRIGDANGDGRQDILYAGADGNVRVVYGNGAGGYSAPVVLETEQGLAALALLDINGDGRQDLAVASGTTGTLQVGTGVPLAGILGTAYSLVAPAAVQTVTAVRVAGDNIVNIAEASAGTVPVIGTLSGPLGAGETLAATIGSVVTPLTGAVIATANGVTTFTAMIPALQASGSVGILVQRTDGAASATLSQAVTVDLTAPTLVGVTSPDAPVTRDAVIDFTLAFSEPVTGLTAASLGLTGTASAGLVPTLATADGGRTYAVTIPAATAEGTLGLTLNTAGLRDAAGNALPGAGGFVPVGPILTLDRTAPVVSLQPIAGDGILSQADLAGGVVLSGTVSGLEGGAGVMVTITDAAGTPVLTTTAPVTGGAFALPLTASVGTTLVDGAYAVSVTAMDAAGNVAVPALANLTVDLTADAGTPVAVTLGTNPAIGLAGVAAVPVVVAGLDAGTTATVVFTDANNATVTATIGLNGTTPVDLTGLTGAVTSAVQLADAAGNTATLPGPVLTVDTLAPVGTAIPAAVQVAGSVAFDVTFSEPVTGLDAADFQVVGTGSILGNVVQATQNPAGGYTIVVGNLSGAGTVGLALSAGATLADGAGNAATLAAVTPVSVDLVAPSRPVITGLLADGGAPTDFLTADTTPTLTGTAEVGSTVTVTYDGPGATTGSLTAVVGPSGTWTATVPPAATLADGAYTFTATAADAAGNVSLSATPRIVTVETATNIPFVLAIDFDDGLVNAAEATGIPYTLTGLPPGASLSVTFTDASGTTVVAALTESGTALDLSSLDGAVTSALTYVPPTGPSLPFNGPGALFDTVLPLAPTVLGFAGAGPGPTTVTGDATPILTGTGEPGSTVTVTVANQTLTVEVDANGDWFVPVTTPLVDGTVTVTATARDAAGNASLPLPGLAVTVDLLADAGAPITVGLALPADGLLNAGEAAALTGTVSGIDPDATATLTFTGQGGSVTVPLVNGVLPSTDLSALAGPVTASVSVVDAVGNRATLPVGGFTIDAVAPAATIVADPAAAPGAASLTYTVTFPEAVANLTASDFLLTPAGTAAGTIASVTEVGGVYTVTVSGITGMGSLALGLSATSDIADRAGNLAVVAQAGLHLVNVPVVVQPGDLPVIAGISADTGLPGDFVTGDPDPVVSGTALPGATVTLTYTDAAGVSASLVAPVNGAGAWSAPLPTLNDGTYTLSATLTDGANNVLGVSASRPLVIDTVGDSGAAVAIAVSATADGVVDAVEANAVAYAVTGLDVGSTAIARFTAGGLVRDVPVSADGTFTVDLSGFDGTVATSLIVTDLAGNGTTAIGNTVRFATAPTALPVIGAVTTDTGTPGDGITFDNTPVLSGTAEVGATVSVTVSWPGGVQTFQAVATDGAWTLALPVLADGAYAVTASATGPSGLPSPASAPFALTIDTNADVVPLVAVQLAAADPRLGAVEAAAVDFALTGLDTGSSGTVAFTDGRTVVTVAVGANGTYTADLSTLSGPVTARAELVDAAGNTVTAGLALPAGLAVDTLAPQGAAVADLSGGAAVATFTYTVSFPEAVANVSVDDFALTGTAGATGAITAVTGAGGTYVVTVAGIQGTGTLSLGLAPTSDIADLAGNLATLTPGIRAVTGVAPVLPVITAYSADTGVQGDGLTADATPTLTGIGQAGATVTVAYLAAGLPQSVSGQVAANGTWSLDIPALADGAYSFTASLTANGTPVGTSTPLAVTIDTTADGGTPASLSVDAAGDQRINAAEAGAVAYTIAGLDADAMGTVTFRDATHGLTVMDVRNGAYTADLSGFSGPVSSVLTIQDPAGNGVIRDGTGVVVDTLAPAGTALPSTPGAGGATSFTYAVTFPEAVLNVTADDFALAGTGTATGRIASVTGSAGSYLVTVADVAGTGTLSLGLTATADIVDGVGNGATLSATPRAVAVGTPPQAALTVITGFGDDTGLPGDGITADNTPILSGTAAAGGTVTVAYAEAGVLKSVTAAVDGTGQWSAAIPILADGSYSFTASAVTAAGAPSGTSGPLALTVDTVADAVPLVSLTVDGPAGGVLTPAQAAAVTFTVAGLDPGSAAVVSFTDGTRTVRVDAGADGAYRADLSGLTGPVTSSFVVSDVAGNDASGSGNGLVIGQDGSPPQNPDPQNPGPQNPSPQNPGPQDPTTPPVIPPSEGTSPSQDAPPSVVAPVVIGVADDTGTPGDGITGDPSPTVAGTGTPGASVTVTYDGGTGPGTVTVRVGADGTFTAALPALADGGYTVVAAGRDAAGNVLQAGQPFRVVVDTVADAGAAVSLAVEPTRDGVVNAVEAIDAAYTVAGLDAGSRATVTFTDGTHTVTTQVTGDGRYAVDLTGLHGTVASAILATDAAGNEARATGNAVLLDTVGPAAPVVTGVSQDTGPVGNGITSDATPTLVGTAEAGSTVAIAYDTLQGPRTATVVAGTDGHWSLDLPPLPEGTYAFVASATDAAGNRGPGSAVFSLGIDPRAGAPVDSGGGPVVDGGGTGPGGTGPGGTGPGGTGPNGTGNGAIGTDGGGTGGGAPGLPGNLAPTPVSDALATTTHAAAVTGNVLANDTDPNAGDTLHVTAVRFANGITVAVPAEGTATVLGNHGTLQIGADGHYSYQAIGSNNLAVGDHTADGFTYTVSDGRGLSASAGITVSLDGVAPAAEATFGFAFTEARVERLGETLVLTGPDGVHHDVGGIGTLHFADGSIQENDGHALVDDVWYLSHNLDVWQARVDADTHYAAFGWHEGRDPNAYFSTQGYLAANADVAAAGIDPLEHYARFGEGEGRSPGPDFQADAYLIGNPDVAATGGNALDHYLRFGQGEGRTVQDGESGRGHTGAFDPGFYLARNPDVAAVAAQAEPLGLAPSDFAFRHYLEHGAGEGRAPSAQFDPGFYLATNPDVAAAGGNPLLHYQEYGWREGRDPSPGFHTNAYLEANPDVAAADIDPLQHYLDYGQAEGRHGV